MSLFTGISKANRKSSAEKPQRSIAYPSERPRPSGVRPRQQQQDRQHAREPHHTSERRQPPERRDTHKTITKNPHRDWNDYRDTSYPEPALNYSPEKSLNSSRSRHKSPREAIRVGAEPAMGTTDVRPVDIVRQQYHPIVSPHRRRFYDSVSDVTRSSGKSEAIRELQEEIVRMNQQMAKMNSPKQTRMPIREEYHPRPAFRRDKLDSVGSDAGSGRSEILAALQNEIKDLRNEIQEQDRSPPRVYSSPLSRESLRDPLREPLRDDLQDRIAFDSPLPPGSKLRETLRQQYIPKIIPREHSFTRTPTRTVLPSSSPYRSSLRNPAPRFESTPFQSSPSYIPETSSYPESPSLTHHSYRPSRYHSPAAGVSPWTGAAPTPMYTSRVESCPMCSGTGVHTHGEYSYPSDFVENARTNPPRTTPHEQNSGRNQYLTQPLAHSEQTHNPSNPPQGQMQASMNTPQHPTPLNYSGQSTVYPQPGVNQQFVQNPQSVFNPRPVSSPAQPVSSQPQQVSYQQQPVSHQQEPVSHQQQPVSYQQEPVSYQQQPVSYQQEPVSYQQPPPPVVNQQQPVSYQQQPPVVSQQQPMTNQQQSFAYQPQPVFSQPQLLLSQPQPQPVLNQPQSTHGASLTQTPTHSTPIPGQVQMVYTPVGNVPLVTIPVYAGVPVNAASEGTSDGMSQKTGEKKRKKSAESQKPSRYEVIHAY